MFNFVRRIAAAAAIAVVGASGASAATLWEAETPTGAFSSSWSSPTAVGAGFTSIRGTGAGNVYDNFVFTSLPLGAQTLELVFEAPSAVDWSYSAGGSILWATQPFRWGWDGTEASKVQLDYYTRTRTVTLSLPETFNSALYLALDFTHGANFSYEIKALSNAVAGPSVPVGPGGLSPIGSADAVGVVPVPAAAALLVSGLAGLGALRLRRRG